MKKINFVKILGVGLLLFVQASLFNNCSKVSTSQSEIENELMSDSSEAIIREGFIAPNSVQGKSVRVISPSSDKLIKLKEYRYKKFERYFWTGRSTDQKIIETGVLADQFTVTGNTITVYETQVQGTSPLCRFYNSVEQTHLYTASESECSQLKYQANMHYEGVEGYVKSVSGSTCSVDTKAIYSPVVKSSNVGRDRMTGSQNLLNQLVANQTHFNNGIKFCAKDLTVLDTSIPSPPVVGNGSCQFNGGTVQNGQPVIAYQASTVAQGQVCVSETRTCTNGTLSGSFQFSTCSSSSSGSCTPNPPVSTGRISCSDGTSYNSEAELKNSSLCSTAGQGKVLLNGNQVCGGVWDVVARCVSETSGGTICPPVENTKKNCSLNGTTIAHGASVITYQNSNVAAGQVCQSQSRTCNDGVLSGSYGYSSCVVNGSNNPPQSGGSRGCTDDPSVPVIREIDFATTRQSFGSPAVGLLEDQMSVVGDTAGNMIAPPVIAVRLKVVPGGGLWTDGSVQIGPTRGTSTAEAVISRCRGRFDSGGRVKVIRLDGYSGTDANQSATTFFPMWWVDPLTTPDAFTALLNAPGKTAKDGWLSDGIYYINIRMTYCSAGAGGTCWRSFAATGVSLQH